MAWVRIDHDWPSHPDFLAGGPLSFALHVAGICYAARWNTGGFIVDGALGALLPTTSRPKRYADALCSVGRWQRDEERGGFVIVGHALVSAPTRSRLPEALRRRVIERDENICGLCGDSVDPEDIHIDHILPRSLGGKDVESNLQVAHSRCNIEKGARV